MCMGVIIFKATLQIPLTGSGVVSSPAREASLHLPRQTQTSGRLLLFMRQHL